jgi:hypothetical protein
MKYSIIPVVMLVLLSITSSWGVSAEAIHPDTVVVHSGRGAARLERDANSSSTFSTITRRIPMDFEGDWLELRGFLSLEGVTQYVGLWMRQDGPAGMLKFDNMQGQGVRGTIDWKEYSIKLPIDKKANDLFFGALVAGGELHWDFELFRLLPAVLDATDRETGNRTLFQWIDKLGVPESCDPCAEAPENTYLLPPIDWIRDTKLLGPALSGNCRTLDAR